MTAFYGAVFWPVLAVLCLPGFWAMTEDTRIRAAWRRAQARQP